MSQAKFVHYDLKLIEPTFDSSLTDLIIELDFLRKKQLSGTTPIAIFNQLKHIFHTLESIGSARIEGNNTTIAEYIETKLDQQSFIPSGIREIKNIEEAMRFIEDNVKQYPINRSFVAELHKIIVDGLEPAPKGEGDKTPGEYRKINPIISNSLHLPPDFSQVEQYMQELYTFINMDVKPKYDLLRAAIAHHRFVWIHPFSNGNGRTVRLFTYAMLIKTGFNIDVGRIINPTAVFCMDRNAYYSNLALADKGDENGILAWSEYVLSGLKREIEKIDKLIDYDYLSKEILIPVIKYSWKRGLIKETEMQVLWEAIDKKIIQAGDLKTIFVNKHDSEISRQIKQLINKKLLMPEHEEKSRKYLIRFDNSFLLRGIIHLLGEKGFLPLKEN